MTNDIQPIRLGLMLAMLTLIFGISMGVLFGANEDAVKSYIETGISANADVHDEKSQSKIWRYAQRAHFHATGVGAFSLAMILLVGFTAMTRRYKKLASTLIGVGSFYSLSWMTMFLLSPSIGRSAAHHSMLTEIITKITVGSMLLGVALLCLHLVFNFGADKAVAGQAARVV